MTLTHLLFALSTPARVRLVDLLVEHGPTPVGKLHDLYLAKFPGSPISRPAVSQHLAVLTKAGLIASQQDGTRIYYRICAEAFRQLRNWTDHVIKGERNPLLVSTRHD